MLNGSHNKHLDSKLVSGVDCPPSTNREWKLTALLSSYPD